MSLREFTRERDAALLSLDRARIEAYARKYGVRLPLDERAFWGSVHKARIEIPTLPAEAKEISRRWLRRVGWKTFTGEEP